jgi:hypothetical protein
MADLASLQASAAKLLPAPSFSGSTPLETLNNGFVAAKAAIFKYVQPNETLSYEQAIAATQLIGSQISQNSDQVKAQLDAGQDLMDAIALQINSTDMKQFILAQYALASAGIGAYTCGLMDQMLQSGGITQAQYDDGISVRIETFSDIVSMDSVGHLSRLLNPSSEASRVISSSPSYAAKASAGQQTFQVKSIVIRTGNTGVYTDPNPGLGLDPVTIGLIIAAIAVVAILLTWYAVSTSNKKLELSAKLAQEQCELAYKYGYKDAVKACSDQRAGLDSANLIDQIIPKEMSSQITTYLLIGAWIYVALLVLPQLLPQLATSFSSTQEALAAHRRHKELVE